MLLVANVDEAPPVVAVDRAGCGVCGSPWPVADVAYDEDEAVVVSAVECRVCGAERRQIRMTSAEVRSWVRRRLETLALQRKAAS